MTAIDQYVGVRYIVDDVQAAVDFYTTHLGFEVNTSAAPAFADVIRGRNRLPNANTLLVVPVTT